MWTLPRPALACATALRTNGTPPSSFWNLRRKAGLPSHRSSRGILSHPLPCSSPPPPPCAANSERAERHNLEKICHLAADMAIIAHYAEPQICCRRKSLGTNSPVTPAAPRILDNRENGKVGEFLREKITPDADSARRLRLFFHLRASRIARGVGERAGTFKFLFGDPRSIGNVDPRRSRPQAFCHHHARWRTWDLRRPRTLPVFLRKNTPPKTVRRMG